MLRSSALLGLAALAQAETIVNTPALGYGSTDVNAFDQDIVKFQYDLSQWVVDGDNPDAQPSGGFQQVLAFKIQKDSAGTTTSLGVSWSGGSSASTKQMTAGPETQWYCVSAGVGANRAWMSSPISVDIGVSCVEPSCSNSPDPTGLGLTGADFRVTAFFYRIAASSGVIDGWGQEACAGGSTINGCWDSTNNRIKESCRDTATVPLQAPWMSVDPVYRDGLSEAFTASWEVLNGGLSGSLSNDGWQTAPVRKSNNDEWIVGNQMVLDATSVSTQGLYSRISGQGDGNGATYMWCFTSSQNWGMRPNGNYRYSANDLWNGQAGACDLGCFPAAADGSCMKPTALSVDPSLMDYKIDWSYVTNNDYNIVASVLVTDNSASGGNTPSDWISPDHKVCFAWGHQCSGASTTGPSAVLAMAALYLASRA
jgi:hypothetical protein